MDIEYEDLDISQCERHGHYIGTCADCVISERDEAIAIKNGEIGRLTRERDAAREYERIALVTLERIGAERDRLTQEAQQHMHQAMANGAECARLRAELDELKRRITANEEMRE